MRATQTTAHAAASALVAAITEGRPITDFDCDHRLSSPAAAAACDLAAIMDDLVATKRRRDRGFGSGPSIMEMLQRAQSAGEFAQAAHDALVSAITALEEAGAVLELRPGLVRTDLYSELDPKIFEARIGVAVRVHPAHPHAAR